MGRSTRGGPPRSPSRRGRPGEGGEEVGAHEDVEEHVGLRAHGRGARDVPQQRPLAELAAALEHTDGEAVDLDDDSPLPTRYQ